MRGSEAGDGRKVFNVLLGSSGEPHEIRPINHFCLIASTFLVRSAINFLASVTPFEAVTALVDALFTVLVISLTDSWSAVTLADIPSADEFVMMNFTYSFEMHG